MRRFHSYGPVDPRFHFSIDRASLVERCVSQLLGEPGEGGHYFTLWAPRQTGKTWLMRRAVEEIRANHPERFIVATLSMQGVVLQNDDPDEAFLRYVPHLFREALGLELEPINDWIGFVELFGKRGSPFDRPLILLIDEFDSLPRRIIDRLVTLFRDMYLKREAYLLHGLALIGIRAVLGVESERGSPFNIQRSLHVPNFTLEEVAELFRQYQEESGQPIESRVIERLFEVTRGQPGLIGWFGELLTEKYNPDRAVPITLEAWERVYLRACRIEWNNTTLNLVKKAKSHYTDRVVALFSRPDVLFSLEQEWCSYLYLNGIIDFQEARDAAGLETVVCRFSSPFVQLRLYNALAGELVGTEATVPVLDLLDDLTEVFTPAGIDAAALVKRYKDYLKRLKERGLDPWREQPRRQDLHLTEAVGHFHLYAWLQESVGRQCVVSPEFPTGNGKVDLLLRRADQLAVLEVKSLRSVSLLREGREQAARYARKLGLERATLALFVPTGDEAVLKRLEGDELLEGVRVVTVAIGWG